MYNSRIELNYLNKPLYYFHNHKLIISFYYPLQPNILVKIKLLFSFSFSSNFLTVSRFKKTWIQFEGTSTQSSTSYNQAQAKAIPRILTNRRLKKQQKIIKFQEKATYHYMWAKHKRRRRKDTMFRWSIYRIQLSNSCSCGHKMAI